MMRLKVLIVPTILFSHADFECTHLYSIALILNDPQGLIGFCLVMTNRFKMMRVFITVSGGSGPFISEL